MPTTIQIGTQLKEIDLLEILPPDEGEINQIYGRIGSGKTYIATREILSDLNIGKIWYVNWKIDWKGYDERKNKWLVLLGILGLKKHFFKYNKENLHFCNMLDLENIIVDNISTGKNFVNWLAGLSDCKIAFDEGHIQFNSYEKTRVEISKLDAIYTARHYDRTYLIISQRPTQVHVSARANVNRFYKMEKTFQLKIPFSKIKLQHFCKTEFQETDASDRPDETRIKDKNMNDTDQYKFAVSQKYYWGRKKYFKTYDSKYRRGDTPTSQPNFSEIYTLKFKDKLKLLLNQI